MPAGFSLVIEKGSEVGKKFTFDRNTVRIGRTATENDMILNDRSISGKHARITFEDGIYFLEDLGSTNKTYFHGGPLEKDQKVQLQNGDEFSLGKIALRFLDHTDEGRDSDTETILTETQAVTIQKIVRKPGIKGESPLKQKPVLVVAAGVALLLILLTLVKIGTRAPETAKKTDALNYPDYSLRPIPLPAPNIYGYCRPDRTHPDKAIFTFAAQSGSGELHYIVGGVDSEGELVILLNGTKIANAPLAMNGWGLEQSLSLPRELINEGGQNQLVFDNTMNPPGKEEWGVKKLRIDFMAAGKCDEVEAKRLFDLGNQMLQEKAVSEGNIYRAYTYYSQAVSQIDGCTPKPVILSEMEKNMRSAKEELESRYNSLVFSYKKAVKLNNFTQARSELERIVQLIPDEKDERHKEAVRLLKKISEYVRRRR
jgi:pSer/pThr/pTyr-binding forkhead associated (FHA) protein